MSNHPFSRANYTPTDICPKNEIIRDGQKWLNPAQKPLHLMKYLVQSFTLPGQTVFEFCSGTCPVADSCMRLQRNCISIDSDVKQVVASARRINNTEEELKKKIAEQELFYLSERVEINQLDQITYQDEQFLHFPNTVVSKLVELIKVTKKKLQEKAKRKTSRGRKKKAAQVIEPEEVNKMAAEYLSSRSQPSMDESLFQVQPKPVKSRKSRTKKKKKAVQSKKVASDDDASEDTLQRVLREGERISRKAKKQIGVYRHQKEVRAMSRRRSGKDRMGPEMTTQQVQKIKDTVRQRKSKKPKASNTPIQVTEESLQNIVSKMFEKMMQEKAGQRITKTITPYVAKRPKRTRKAPKKLVIDQQSDQTDQDEETDEEISEDTASTSHKEWVASDSQDYEGDSSYEKSDHEEKNEEEFQENEEDWDKEEEERERRRLEARKIVGKETIKSSRKKTKVVKKKRIK